VNSELGPDQFPDFFAAVNGGHLPFPWQARLVQNLFDSNGLWPDLLDLPTASGKSSTVDVAVFALAAGLPVPRRTVFVVDRRVVVQQAADHARHLAQLLAESSDPPVRAVADGLRRLHADVEEQRPPLVVAELRGAIEQDRRWAERPDVPAVIASTVDQVGSRLLFRGYGVSDRMAPVHAGLLGNDTLILLDEVHLASPFASLLRRIHQRYRPGSPSLPDRWQVVELSATPTRASTDTTLSLEAEDREHPVLGQRLSARKPTRLLACKVPADPDRAQLALAAKHTEQVTELLTDDRVQSVAVVVNRVQLASLVHRQLMRKHGDAVEIRLITGRMRGYERNRILERVKERVGSRTARDERSSEAPQKIVVVATQTIEAGADLDFDVLVTDCASIDALVQRFGRVDRLGEFSARMSGCPDPPLSVIVGTGRLTKDRVDPVYGTALSATWDWLAQHGEQIDFGVSSSEVSEARGIPQLMAPRPTAPTLTRSHLDRLVRTSPRPDADVDVDSFLHGLGRRPDPDVEVVWRQDISAATLRAIASQHQIGGRLDELSDLISAIPPTPDEAVSVPILQAKEWLGRSRPGDQPSTREGLLSDLETPSSEGTPPQHVRPCLVWRAGDCFVTTSSADLRPGDTLIVPSTYGGLEAGNWAPSSVQSVVDVAEEAARTKGRVLLRLNPATLNPDDFPALGLPTAEDIESISQTERSERFGELLEKVRIDRHGDPMISGRIPTPESTTSQEVPAPTVLQHWLSRYASPRLLEAFGQIRKRNVQIVTSDFGPIYLLSNDIDRQAIDSEPRRSSATACQYPLDGHLRDVAEWAAKLVDALGIQGRVAEAVVDAARLHDLGKADIRFQAYLREGAASPGSVLLAKSDIPPQDLQRNRLARQRSGYPQGLRHEVASVALADDLLATADSGLTRFLIAAHHGYGRPFFPAQVDTAQLRVDYQGEQGVLGSETPYRVGAPAGATPVDFAAAVRTYGWWGVAWLEAILRLADHGASRECAAAVTERRAL
jgi:CRISPR-associated endonuclease/helicase Cas3